MNHNAVIPFQFRDQRIRALNIDGDPWFVAKDVCDVLGYQNSRKAVGDHLDEDERRIIDRRKLSNDSLLNSREGNQTLLIISESGLYALIVRSHMPKARAFRKWVTSEVLPSIRKTGAYIHPAVDPGEFEMPLTAEVLTIKPALRLRLYSEARQTANMAGGGPETVPGYFLTLCRMMAARPVGSSDVMSRFMDECLEEVNGWRTSFRDILAAFARWWPENSDGPIPSGKALSSALAWRFQRFKSNRSVFRNCRLKPPVDAVWA